MNSITIHRAAFVACVLVALAQAWSATSCGVAEPVAVQHQLESAQ